MIHRIIKVKKSDIKTYKEFTTGESLERKIEKMLLNGEQLETTKGLVYQERKEGINPAYDIRTDRFTIAQQASGAISKSKILRREQWLKEKEENKKQENEGQ